jgi:hypothetical protein
LSRALILGNKIDNIFGITLMGNVRVCYWGIVGAKCRKKRFNNKICEKIIMIFLYDFYSATDFR